MATIKTVLSIQDAMTKPLRSINRAMNLVISSMEQMQKATRKPVDTKALKAARDELAKMGAAIDDIEEKPQELVILPIKQHQNSEKSWQLSAVAQL